MCYSYLGIRHVKRISISITNCTIEKTTKKDFYMRNLEIKFCFDKRENVKICGLWMLKCRDERQNLKSCCW